MGHVARNPDLLHSRSLISALVFFCSLQSMISKLALHNFNILNSLCSCTSWLENDVVGNVEAHMVLTVSFLDVNAL